MSKKYEFNIETVNCRNDILRIKIENVFISESILIIS